LIELFNLQSSATNVDRNFSERLMEENWGAFWGALSAESAPKLHFRSS